VVNTPRAKATLCDLEPAAFAQQNIVDRHPHILEIHLDVAMRRVVVPHHIQRPDDADPLGVGRYQYHALL